MTKKIKNDESNQRERALELIEKWIKAEQTILNNENERVTTIMNESDN
ncbi:hypothetical protein J2T12_003537 [Paenibacillus anaericanus]|nr:hypothetical protein [Paenibacillus anaericanus]MDQ0090123.1 hypothetical protein [Paenibacillus anaericanus]